MEEEIQRKVEDFRAIGLPAYIPREGSVHLVKNSVSTLIGARRAGKSYRAMQVADDLIKAKTLHSLRQICKLDFDSPVLSKLTAEGLQIVPSIFLKITPELDLRSPLLFIFDEIHRIEGWENAVIELSRNPNWKVIVTGSSSRLLRDDVATELRGKSVSSIVYPLSFSEFLAFKGFQGSANSTKGGADIRRYFDDYLKWGGYPAIPDLEDPAREALLREYFDTMILRDIIQRYDVSKPRACVQACRYLLSNNSKPTTASSVFEYVRESGLVTSRNAIRDYIDWARDSWLLFMVDLFSKSHKEQERNYKKTYCIDWGLACQNSTVWDGSLSRAFENMIYLQLIRHYPRVHYYLTKTSRQEVDFVALDNRGKIQLAMQVCVDISEKDTLKREISPLVTTAKYFGIPKTWLITLKQEKLFREEGITIHAIPAWKWLIGAAD